MEPTTIAIIVVVIVAVVVVVVLLMVNRGNRASVADLERGPAAIPARPSHIPATIRRKNRTFTPCYHREHDSWGFFLGADWIVYDMLMDGAYLGLFDEAYPDEPFFPEGEEPGAYAPEPESVIEAAPEVVAPHEPEPVSETVSEAPAPEPAREPTPDPAPSYDPPSEDRFGSSDFGSSDFGSSDFGGGDD